MVHDKEAEQVALDIQSHYNRDASDGNEMYEGSEQGMQLTLVDGNFLGFLKTTFAHEPSWYAFETYCSEKSVPCRL